MTYINKITLYSTNCPNCKVLKIKLDEKKIEYGICSDVEVMKQKGFKSVPMLEVGETILNYFEATNWIKEQ